MAAIHGRDQSRPHFSSCSLPLAAWRTRAQCARAPARQARKIVEVGGVILVRPSTGYTTVVLSPGSTSVPASALVFSFVLWQVLARAG